MLMRSYMDEVEYNARGNEVCMVKRRPPDPSPEGLAALPGARMSASPSRPLELHVDRRAAAAVVRVKGSVSMDEADRLRHQIELLAGEQCP